MVNAADMDEGARMKGFGGEPVAWPMIKDRMDLMGFFSHGTDSIWIYSSTFYSKKVVSVMGGSEADHASTGQRWPQEKIPRLLRGPMRRGTHFLGVW